MLNVLVVEPDTKIAARLRQPIHKLTTVEMLRRFDAAKKRVAEAPLDFLVTNLRLADFNGLHLVYLAATATNPPRAIVYTDGRDPWRRDPSRGGPARCEDHLRAERRAGDGRPLGYGGVLRGGRSRSRTGCM